MGRILSAPVGRPNDGPPPSLPPPPLRRATFDLNRNSKKVKEEEEEIDAGQTILSGGHRSFRPAADALVASV